MPAAAAFCAARGGTGFGTAPLPAGQEDDKMSENRSGTRYHEMDAGCMTAFRDFLGRANALPGVRVHLTGIYRRAYNDVQKQDGKAGTRLVLEFFGAPSNQTYYTFHMPELHGKNQYAPGPGRQERTGRGIHRRIRQGRPGERRPGEGRQVRCRRELRRGQGHELDGLLRSFP